MTDVYYDCVDRLGNSVRVNTLSQAKQIQEEGGSYQIKYVENVSQCIAYARKDSRRYGDMR